MSILTFIQYAKNRKRVFFRYFYQTARPIKTLNKGSRQAV